VLAVALSGVRLESGKLVFDEPAKPAVPEAAVMMADEGSDAARPGAVN
jgi:hypothetical protein